MVPNQKFTDHVTGVAFSLTLSKRQIDVLLAIDMHGFDFRELCNYSHCVPTMRSLEDRGLITREGGWKTTKAGNLSCSLLREAGIESSFLVKEKAA